MKWPNLLHLINWGGPSILHELLPVGGDLLQESWLNLPLQIGEIGFIFFCSALRTLDAAVDGFLFRHSQIWYAWVAFELKNEIFLLQ